MDKKDLCFNGYSVFYRGKFKDLYQTKDGRYFVRYKRSYREIDIEKYEVRQRLLY